MLLYKACISLQSGSPLQYESSVDEVDGAGVVGVVGVVGVDGAGVVGVVGVDGAGVVGAGVVVGVEADNDEFTPEKSMAEKSMVEKSMAGKTILYTNTYYYDGIATHADEPAVEVVPDAQAVHVVDPVVAEYVPAAQPMHPLPDNEY